MSDDVVIRVEGIWKSYGLQPETLRRLRRMVRGNWRGVRSSRSDGRLWALKDINLEVRRGETLGIMGRNGAGKSTLLKLLAGVSPVTRGKIQVMGRVFPMIELSAGLHPELTGRENVLLLGAIMGLDRDKMTNLLPAIEEFCELGDYFNRPARTYSSGMLARLGFGVAMNVEADIVLIDEVLAVGDIGFQRKCYQRIHELQRGQKTILLVSHNPYVIERHCSSALIMRNGQVEASGTPAEMFYKYFVSFAESDGVVAAPKAFALPETRPGGGQIRITRIQLLNSEGQETHSIRPGEVATFRFHFQCNEVLESPNFGIQIQTLDNLVVASLETTGVRRQMSIHSDGYFDCTLPFYLTPNVYVLRIKVAQDGLVDLVENARQFRVEPDSSCAFDTGNMGLLYLKPEWQLEQ